MHAKTQGRFSPTRHETYTKQLNRPAKSFEEIKLSRAIQAAEKADGVAGAGTGELLHFAGGDNRMTWAKGEAGMRLRTVLAYRALHVQKQIKKETAQNGNTSGKKETFYDREIAPFFKDGMSSSSEEDDSLEQQQLRRAKKVEEQRQLMRAKRDEEDKRAMEALRLRRLKEKYTR